MPIDLIVEWRLRSTAGVRSVLAALGLAITLDYYVLFLYSVYNLPPVREILNSSPYPTIYGEN
jgi:hypothetical protein